VSFDQGVEQGAVLGVLQIELGELARAIAGHGGESFAGNGTRELGAGIEGQERRARLPRCGELRGIELDGESPALLVVRFLHQAIELDATFRKSIQRRLGGVLDHLESYAQLETGDGSSR